MTREDLSRSGPIVQVSRRALASNMRSLAASGPAAVDVRADAYGHDAQLVAETAQECGLEVFDGSQRRLPALLDPERVFGIARPATELLPVMRMTGAVLSIKELHRGEGVSYGFRHRAPEDTRIALVTGGYAQGVVRALGNSVDVSIAGARHRIVGRVAMDVCVVDVGTAPVTRGETVVLFGDAGQGEPTLAEWADACRLTPLELTAACGDLARREAVL